MSARYQTICVIATGGMGTVDVVVRREEGFERLFALKRLHAHLRADPTFLAMFREEARLAALIRHPNVVSVVDFGSDDDGPFLVMDYVDGLSVAETLATEGPEGAPSPPPSPLPLPFCLSVARDAARGLHAAHELADHQGRPLALVHRDVSPKNILVGFDGVARVTDFGIAKALDDLSRTTTGIIKGSLGYVSPEALRFQPLGRQSDLFSLGVVLHEMVTGERLYAGGQASEIARRILDEPPPDILAARPGAPPGLLELLFELLAKDPAHRPATAALVADRLDGLLHDLTAAEGPFDAARFMCDAYAAERERRAEVVAQGVKRVVATGLRRPRPAARRNVLALVVLAAAALVAWRVLRTTHGLLGEYFGDAALQDPKMSRIDPEIAFDWENSSPDPRIRRGIFSVRWTGWLSTPANAPVSSLCVLSDDGNRLWLDGHLVINEWHVQWPMNSCAEVRLAAATRHRIQVDYMQAGGFGYVRLFWTVAGPGPGSVPVPSIYLLPPRPGDPPPQRP